MPELLAGAERNTIKPLSGQFQAGLMLCDQYLNENSPVRVLELGTGTGRLAARLAQTLPKDSTVVGIDRNQRQHR